ncbi:MAG: peptide-methionine (R)-S-oxide reductase MsrB [Akkermansiaceae bacterium]|nr:peptide-methionine (R)-S-oxide reductase MsrB [Akkermansiaceae bacterium]NNM28888.1 peptide-methionine (R)-S-oxide reductase MsrB [Akkermansiaceae bacterium]
MKRLFPLAAALGGLALLTASCDEARADKDSKTKKTAMATADEAPEQPATPVEKSDAEWKKELTDEQYYVLRKAGTERPYGKVYDEFKHQGAGTYYCAGCDAELFNSKVKFDSGCGWPSFYDPSKAKNVKTKRDLSAGMVRIEVRCAVCDGHLGHVFEGEGFNTPTDQRYCINGVALKFVPDAAKKDDKTGGEAGKKKSGE